MDTKGRKPTLQDLKSGGEVAEHFEPKRTNAKRYAKSDVRYWESKLFHDAYSRDGKRVQGTDWSVRIQHQGRRESFPLRTPNKTAAGAKAKDIYFALNGAGWEEALQRFKPEAAAPVLTDATVGDLIREVTTIGGLRPKTLADYAKALRLIVAEVFEIDGGRDKFDPHTGGRLKWLEQVEAVPLADLTPDKVQRWKLAFLRRAGSDPAKQRRAKTSVNSLLRQAKSLFSKKALRFLTLKLPDPLPFDGVQFEPRQSMRYHSAIEPWSLISVAQAELANGEGNRPEQYKVFLLSLCAGLRRNEIDKLEWNALDFTRHVFRIEATEFLHPKTEESTGEIEIDPQVSEIFERLRQRSGGRFVIESDRMPILDATYSTYRCKPVFDGLTKWLKENGVVSQKPLHELRKEFGSTIANEHGIFAASRALRHTDISITTRHYADKKRRVTAGFGTFFQPPAETPTT